VYRSPHNVESRSITECKPNKDTDACSAKLYTTKAKCHLSQGAAITHATESTGCSKTWPVYLLEFLSRGWGWNSVILETKFYKRKTSITVQIVNVCKISCTPLNSVLFPANMTETDKCLFSKDTESTVYRWRSYFCGNIGFFSDISYHKLLKLGNSGHVILRWKVTKNN